MEFINVTINGKQTYIRKDRINEVYEFINYGDNGEKRHCRIQGSDGIGWNVVETVDEMMAKLKE